MGDVPVLSAPRLASRLAADLDLNLVLDLNLDPDSHDTPVKKGWVYCMIPNGSLYGYVLLLSRGGSMENKAVYSTGLGSGTENILMVLWGAG